MSPRPHPILKRDSSPFRTPTLPFSACGPLFSPHVHFPPTPRIADTYPAHSPTTYDRAPIAVSPNICQLPRRGERKVQSPPADFEADRRGRTRARSKGRGSGPGSGEAVKGSYFHPRAYEACMPEPPSSAPPSAAGTRSRATLDDSPSPPALVADLSPSDESDQSVTTPPDPNLSAAIASAMPLHFSGAPAPLHRSPLGVADAPARDVRSPPPRMRPSPRARRRPNLMRTETRLERTFSPDLDEGCLGGF